MTNHMISGIFRHYKNGDFYFAEKLAEDHDTGVKGVVYHALYAGPETAYWKGEEAFHQMVSDGAGGQVKRFTLVEAIRPGEMKMFLLGSKLREIGCQSTHVVEKYIAEEGRVLVGIRRVSDNGFRTFYPPTILRIFESAEEK
jgi:hypothetical protein